MNTAFAISAGASIATTAAAANAARIAAQQQEKKTKEKHECAIGFVSPYLNCPSNADDPHGYSECVAMIGAPEHELSGVEAVGFAYAAILIIFGVGFAIHRIADYW